MSCGGGIRIILSRSQAKREEKDPVTDCLTMHSWLLQFQSKTLVKSQCSKVQLLPERIYILSSPNSSMLDTVYPQWCLILCIMSLLLVKGTHTMHLFFQDSTVNL